MIAIITIIASMVIVSINPAKRFKDSRESQRKANVETILNAIQQNIVDNKGVFTCTANPAGYKAFDNNARTIKYVASAADAGTTATDLAPCIADYLATLPFDPSISGAKWVSPTDYNTEYKVKKFGTVGQITVSAQSEVDQDGDGDVDSSDLVSVTR
jgi:type II secretory pathway pseudopilin PulG